MLWVHLNWQSESNSLKIFTTVHKMLKPPNQPNLLHNQNKLKVKKLHEIVKLQKPTIFTQSFDVLLTLLFTEMLWTLQKVINQLNLLFFLQDITFS